MRALFCLFFLSTLLSATYAYVDGECWNADQCGENQVCSFGYPDDLGGNNGFTTYVGEDDQLAIALETGINTGNDQAGYGFAFFSTQYTGSTWLSFNLAFESRMWNGNGGMGFSVNIATFNDVPSASYDATGEEGYDSLDTSGNTVHISLEVDTFSEDEENAPGDFVGLSVAYGANTRSDPYGTHVADLKGLLPDQLRSPDWVPVTFTAEYNVAEDDYPFVFTYGSQSLSGVLPDLVIGDIYFFSRTSLDCFTGPDSCVWRDDQFAIRNVGWQIVDEDDVSAYGGFCDCICPGTQGCSPDGICTDYDDLVYCGEEETLCYENEECVTEDSTCYDVEAPYCYEDGALYDDYNFAIEYCGYLNEDEVTPGTGDYTLRVDFKAPSYIFNDELEQTFLCARSNMDMPRCYGDPFAEDDDVRIKIPNVLDVRFPCHWKEDFLGPNYPIWGFDAWAIPPVSGLASHVDLTFTKTEEILPPHNNYWYWGFGLSNLFITRVRFETEAEKILARELYYGEIANRSDYNFPYEDEYMRFLPDVCDPRFANVDLVHDFWSTCANKWQTIEEDEGETYWNAQTPDNACYCRGVYAPYARIEPTESYGIPSFPTTDAQYFWWFGTCNGCIPPYGEDDPLEGSPVYLPTDNLDTDGDGVPNNCDLCDFFDDSIDTDGDSIPDLCDKCEGYDDRVDINQNGIPDGCDLCNLAVVGCGDHATCTEGEEPGTFTCSCDSGYAIVGDKVDIDGIAANLAGNYSSILAWANARSDIISEDVEDNTFHDYEPYYDGTITGDAFSFQFVLKSSLSRLSIDALFQSFTDFLYDTVTDGCGESCSTLAFSYTWSQKVDSATQVTTTTYKLIVQLFAVEFTYTGPGQVGDSRGCVDINECDLLGCVVSATGDDSASCYDSTTQNQTLRTDVNERLCVCPDGYVGSRLLKGPFTQFPGCRPNPYA